jgi:hypothetical protein
MVEKKDGGELCFATAVNCGGISHKNLLPRAKRTKK